MVPVQVEIVPVDPQGRLRREPVLGLGRLRVAEFEEFVQEVGREDVEDADATGAPGVEEEEELADGRAEVEGFEGGVEAYESHRKVFQFFFGKVTSFQFDDTTGVYEHHGGLARDQVN